MSQGLSIIKICSFIINKDKLPTIKELQKANLNNPCIIIDDWINSVNIHDFNLIKQYTTQISRVSGCTLCVLVQNYKKLDITFRSNFTIFVLFLSNVHKPVYQNTIENLFNGNITKEQEDDLSILLIISLLLLFIMIALFIITIFDKGHMTDNFDREIKRIKKKLKLE